MGWLGLDVKTINDFFQKIKQDIQNLAPAIQVSIKAADTHTKMCENANSFIDMGKHTLIGGLIGGAISAMTGIRALMPIGALIGIGIGYDFNNWQNKEKPEGNNLLDLGQKYLNFRLNRSGAQASGEASNDTKLENNATQEAQVKKINELNDNVKQAKQQAKTLFTDNKLPPELLTLPTQFLNTPDVVKDGHVDDTVLNTALENHKDWKSLTQKTGPFYNVTNIFETEEKNILIAYIKAEILRLHAQNKEEEKD